MTEDQLKAIEAQASVATPAPWKLAPDGATIVDNRGEDVAVRFTQPRFRQDLEFLAAARTDVPALTVEVRDLQERIRALARLLVEFDGSDFSAWTTEQQEAFRERVSAVLRTVVADVR